MIITNFLQLKTLDRSISHCIRGFLYYRRVHKNIVFIILRSNHIELQCITKDADIINKIGDISNESYISLTGQIKDKISKDDKELSSIEFIIESIEVITAAEPLPFDIRNAMNNSVEVKEKFRYLDLRNPEVFKLLQIRNKVVKLTRLFFWDNDFEEIETPLITCSSDEGAKDYLVTSEKIGKDERYALPQSPQIYKQLLMLSDCHRYFQIARCFRDEEARNNRLPLEFTQIDVEMIADNVSTLIEFAIKYTKHLLSIFKPNCVIIEQSISYNKAMSLYGTDKPDMRVVKKYNLRREDDFIIIDNIDNIYKEIKALGAGIDLEDNMIYVDMNTTVFQQFMILLSSHVDVNEVSIVIVKEFPFYEYDKNGNLTFKHNPFTKTYANNPSEVKDNIDLLTHQFDLVINGDEIASGGIRENRLEFLNVVANMPDPLQGYKYGSYTHGGFAIGIERFVKCMLSTEYNIRSFFSFFPLNNGVSVLMGMPSKV